MQVNHKKTSGVANPVGGAVGGGDWDAPHRLFGPQMLCGFDIAFSSTKYCGDGYADKVGTGSWHITEPWTDSAMSVDSNGVFVDMVGTAWSGASANVPETAITIQLNSVYISGGNLHIYFEIMKLNGGGGFDATDLSKAKIRVFANPVLAS